MCIDKLIFFIKFCNITCITNLDIYFVYKCCLFNAIRLHDDEQNCSKQQQKSLHFKYFHTCFFINLLLLPMLLLLSNESVDSNNYPWTKSMNSSATNQLSVLLRDEFELLQLTAWQLRTCYCITSYQKQKPVVHHSAKIPKWHFRNGWLTALKIKALHHYYIVHHLQCTDNCHLITRF